MAVKNLSNGKRIVGRIIWRRSDLEKAFGLMFRRKLKDSAMIFVFDSEELQPLHMWFVFSAIDVLFLDSSKRVVEIKKGFRPFRFYSPRARARYIIELPEGAIVEAGVKVGDRIGF